ncbi:AtpZ/AtpI family protein [Desulfoscipio gibsoniae]|uniref:F0F1-ATPase subunit, putative n=1 Tax=Desulfoscipio gibsoniae DSM 7213 TaxID=767817 RepID=R4KJN6_9FIRM|nr:AtpZ/AtpI family protein [Desulfoscipio gibsoniae]AGL03413.1 F0F1-ATPase subunit, putative [Desulfoscipio gibsoniae DSM 7213]
MAEYHDKDAGKAADDLVRQIQKKEMRKMKARQEQARSIWFGLGMFGMVGWSVTIPALLGVALGVWIDARWPGPFSWTLMLLVGGLLAGCINAWYWVERERKRR